MKRCLIALTAGVLSLTTGVSLAAAATPELGIQTVDQSASSAQAAVAASGAAQTNPSNTNISIRVLSPGDDGSVSQTNSVGSNASASNGNSSDQDSNQSQAAGGTGACCPSGSTGIQSASQSAANAQLAAALSSATQTGASNTNVPVRVLSPGNDGPVSQTNSVDSNASAQNENAATQAVDQEQSAGGVPSAASTATCCPAAPSLGVQTIDQQAGNHQAALAGSHATQENPENTNVSVRVLSPGNGGSVSQTNSVDSNASAGNSNDANQSANQTQSSGGASTGACCPSGSTGIQIANQGAWNEQAALAGSKAEQSGASNTNVPIRVLSPGDDGGVWQTNSVQSGASAANSNSSTQNANQNQYGGSGSGLGIQTAGQESSNAQAALAGSLATQEHASNSNSPIRVLSPGNGGSVVQTNSVSSGAAASNSNNADQSANQAQSAGGSTGACCPSGSTGIQIAGQSAQSGQLAVGLSGAAQEGASNSNAPVRVLSPGNDGGVWQTNSVESDASASNSNSSDQSATQNQSSGAGMSACCPGGGLGIQVIGQEAKNHQGAAALSAAFQAGASNENEPLRVLSPGDDGFVVQSNSVASGATATNSNEVDQTADQTQGGGGSSNCLCPSGAIGIQALGQSSWNAQGSLAASFAAQQAGRSPCGCPEGASNVNDPIRVLSPGSGGSVWQTNSVESDATGSNTNSVDQSASQSQSGAGAQLGIQAAGQSAQNFQLAAALSAALQMAPKNSNKPLSVLSPGGGGTTTQWNNADSDASGGNRNHASQLARQIAM